ncbi:MAG: hypothetical protein ACREIA_26060 [Opitutaceae bacterium]
MINTPLRYDTLPGAKTSWPVQVTRIGSVLGVVCGLGLGDPVMVVLGVLAFITAL